MNSYVFVGLFLIGLLSGGQCQDGAADIKCFEPGECILSPVVREWSDSDAQECLELCRGLTGCEYFTHYEEEKYCLGFADCVGFSDDTCNDCYSGNSSCPDLQCWVNGECVGTRITSTTGGDETECLDACKANPLCNWFTYDAANTVCLILADCIELVTDQCFTCWSSQKQCSERQDYTKILVVGGYGRNIYGLLDEVEVIDLASDLSSCAPVANYPVRIGYAAGDFVADRPSLCGGDVGTTATDLCYQYYHESNQWIPMSGMSTMSITRLAHQASVISPVLWFISGGREFGSGADYLDSTETWLNGEREDPATTLPKPLKGHCQLTLNSSHVIILGGFDGYEQSRSMYFFDLYNHIWINLPDIPSDYDKDFCGLIENPDSGKEVVISTGPNDCYIFNLRDEVWRDGPLYPEGVSYAASTVQQIDNFLVLGGYFEDGNFTEAIYEFDHINYQWNRKSMVLSQPKAAFAAIAVPDYVVNCS